MRRNRAIVWLAPVLLSSLAIAACQETGNTQGSGTGKGNGKGQHNGEGRGRNRDMPANETSAALSAADTQKASALYAATCAACHGPQRQGGIGPSLVDVGARYSQAKIEQIAQFGKGRKKPVPMPAGLATAEEAQLLARWLAGDSAVIGKSQ